MFYLLTYNFKPNFYNIMKQLKILHNEAIELAEKAFILK